MKLALVVSIAFALAVTPAFAAGKSKVTKCTTTVTTWSGTSVTSCRTK